MLDSRLRRPARRRLLAGSVLLLALAQTGTYAAPDLASFSDASPTEIAIQFGAWQARFREQALAAGIRPAFFDRVFSGISPDPAVVRADRSQPEFSKPIWDYLDGVTAPARVRRGQQLLAIHSNTLTQLEQRYGVPRHILVAVWGMESNFGSNMGDNNVIRALATLAFEGRRPQFASEQLLAALQILQQGDVTPERMLGSWAGAMGQTQFIPSTYQQHAVDFDGDGRRDIWTSSADALASTANYLKSSGWQRGQQWGVEVNLPANFDYGLADMDLRKSVAEWRALGVRPIGTLYGGAADAQSASLLLPAGYRGPAFLVFDNFRSILRYNNSAAYAMGVSLLAAQFYGGGQIIARWPRDEVMLTRTERIEMQQLLLNLGLYSGETDGIIGTNTKRAIRSSQQQLNLPADGYPTKRLLERLRTLTL